MHIQIHHRSEDNTVEVVLQRGNTVRTVTYTSPNVCLVPRGEAAVAALLLEAMVSGEDLHINAPLDAVFLDNLSEVQTILTSWVDTLTRVHVHAERATTGATEAKGGVAAFFSGGVDSLYTFLKHKDQIDALILVHGFDFKLSDTELRTMVSPRLRKVAEEYGKRLIEVETDLRHVTDRKRFTSSLANWELSHGAALVSVAYLLSDQFDKIYIPASQTYSKLIPWGSHPLLDPLWSSASIQICHDGCEADRVEKGRFVSNYKPALDALRVCNKGGARRVYNCGTCEKCIRTKLMLYAIDKLEECDSFCEGLRAGDVGGLWIRDARLDGYYREMASHLSKKGDWGVAWAIRKAIIYSLLKRGVKKMYNASRSIKLFGFS